MKRLGIQDFGIIIYSKFIIYIKILDKNQNEMLFSLINIRNYDKFILIIIVNPIDISKERYLINDINNKIRSILPNNSGNSNDEDEKKNNDKRNINNLKIMIIINDKGAHHNNSNIHINTSIPRKNKY